MFVKIKFTPGMSVVSLARFVGVAPCSILAANACDESQLYGREILLPVATPSMVRALSHIYEADEAGRIKRVLLN